MSHSNPALNPALPSRSAGRGLSQKGAVGRSQKTRPAPVFAAESRGSSSQGRSRAQFSQLAQLFDVTKATELNAHRARSTEQSAKPRPAAPSAVRP